MAITPDIERIVWALENEGYRVDIEQHAGNVTLTASKGSLKVNILFQREAGTIKRVFLSFSDRPGLTVLKCEEPDKVEDCIRKLLDALKRA